MKTISKVRFGSPFGKTKLVNTYALFLKHYTHARKFDGEHQLNDSALRHALLPLLGELLGERLEQAKQPPLPDYMQY